MTDSPSSISGPVSLTTAMRFRCIGPPRGGRVVAVAGDPIDPAVFYFGAVAGGVFKTTDAGVSWFNISDGWFETSSVGALAVCEGEPSVIVAGMGESAIRTDVSHGDGVWISTDRGHRWRHAGLGDTRHISEVRIHPRDPDRIHIAALGHAFGPHPARGIYRTLNGGANWERTLYLDDRTGAADLALDPLNPSILYASLWRVHRNFWELSSGGPGSGLWRSDDGGATWNEITSSLGLPASTVFGKIGISASAARSGRVFALVESDIGPGLYRSDDFGAHWDLVSDLQDLRYRPWYYMHVFADPIDTDTVYVNNLRMWKSTDGGVGFTKIATPHGDNHDLWIDPRNNRRMIQSNDGGANISFNGGDSWSSIHNQLTAQFYTVDTDGQAPFYRVYGTQQDNSSIGVPSGCVGGAITWSDCRIAGTGESGYIAVDPACPDVVYVGAIGSSPGGGGALQRYDHRSGQIRLVNVWPEHHGGMGAGELRYRFGWTFPILFSPHDPNLLYTGGNRVFRSLDQGQSWEPISPDLTRASPDRLGPSGGPITLDTSGAEHYCTLYALAESPLEPGTLWAGSDDGLVHISRDAGANWQDVTPPELPPWSFIRTIEPSPHRPGKAYLAATRYKLDDPSPLLFKTCDHGRSWVSIVGDRGVGVEGAGGVRGESENLSAGDRDRSIPADDFSRVIRADPHRPGLLYLGTESGLYLSLDDGQNWRRWRSNFPVTPVYDLKIEGSDLVIATHGRSFWILDDLTPLHRQAAGDQDLRESDSLELFAPRRTWRVLPGLLDFITEDEGKGYGIGLGQVATFITRRDESGQVRREFFDAGESAPEGAIVYYRLPESAVLGLGGDRSRADGDDAGRDRGSDRGEGGTARASLAFLDADDNLIREFSPRPAGYDDLDDQDQALDPGPWMPFRIGVNRFVWDLRHPGSLRLRGNKMGLEAMRGPLVLPGIYKVRLRVGDQEFVESFELVNDPRSPAGIDDLREQLESLLEIRDKISAAYATVQRIRKIRKGIDGWRERLIGASPSADESKDHEASRLARSLAEALDEVESDLIHPGEHTDTFGLHHRVRLSAALASVISIIDSADAKPTAQALALAREYMDSIDQRLARFDRLRQNELATLNRLIAKTDLPAIDDSPAAT
ncbi:MAG: glycosyl hydrolase [Ectothiorhodospiraceae bacterium AqS1]|nr:glycosyl hydrolase [Ectothiorhodospiraceae bacterium AqS1]